MDNADATRSWSQNGATLSAVQRPDQAWSLRLPDDRVAAWGALLQSAAADIGGTMLVSRPADEGVDAESQLRRAGFTPVRVETVWRLPVAGLLDTPPVSTVHRLVSVDSLVSMDAEAVATLDNDIRRDIPGTESWVGDGAQLTASLDDPEFDPALYRVAQHPVTGSLDGLVRVWSRSPEPRLGCVGVTRPWRRTRLALSLLQEIAHTLHVRGITHLTTETDPTNRASHLMAAHHGGEVMRTTVEWQRPGRST